MMMPLATTNIEISPKPFDADRMKDLVAGVMQAHIEREVARAKLKTARAECEDAEVAYSSAKSAVNDEVARNIGVDRFKL